MADDLWVDSGCGDIERKNVRSKPAEYVNRSLPQCGAPSAGGKPFNAVENLSHGDSCDSQFVLTVSEHPRPDGRRGFGLHQLRDDVGVRDDHVVKSTARGGVDREGTSRSIPPRSPKRSTSAPRTPASSSGSRTASTRMARISASIERPWAAARIRNRSRTVSSKFRMLTAAIQPPPTVIAMLAFFGVVSWHRLSVKAGAVARSCLREQPGIVRNSDDRGRPPPGPPAIFRLSGWPWSRTSQLSRASGRPERETVRTD